MPEGELRTLLVEQLRLMLGPMLEERRTPNTAANAVEVYCDLVAGVVLAVLRPHLGPGVTERAALTAVLDDLESSYRGGSMGTELEGQVATLRAIAGRGEGADGR